jgi:hypothetical protein
MGYFTRVLVDAAKLWWQMPEHEAGRWPRRALRFSFEGSVVSAGLVCTDWCGDKSITEQIQHRLNMKVTAQAKGNHLAWRATPPESHHSTPCVVSLRWTHRMMTMTSRRWRVSRSVRAVLTNLWLTGAESAAAHTSGVRKASQLAPRLLDQGRNVAEYLAVLPSRDARVIAELLGVESSCAGRLDQKVPAGACLHAGAQGDMEACVHRMLCSAVQSSVDEFRSGLWPAELGAPMDRTWCILSGSEWNADKTRVDKVRLLDCSRTCSAESICAGRSLGGWIYGGG